MESGAVVAKRAYKELTDIQVIDYYRCICYWILENCSSSKILKYSKRLFELLEEIIPIIINHTAKHNLVYKYQESGLVPGLYLLGWSVSTRDCACNSVVLKGVL